MTRFEKFQFKFIKAQGKGFKINLKPVFYLHVYNYFTIPDFAFQILFFKILFFTGHHEWWLIFRIFNKEKRFMIK